MGTIKGIVQFPDTLALLRLYAAIREPKEHYKLDGVQDVELPRVENMINTVYPMRHRMKKRLRRKR